MNALVALETWESCICRRTASHVKSKEGTHAYHKIPHCMTNADNFRWTAAILWTCLRVLKKKNKENFPCWKTHKHEQIQQLFLLMLQSVWRHLDPAVHHYPLAFFLEFFFLPPKITFSILFCFLIHPKYFSHQHLLSSLIFVIIDL